MESTSLHCVMALPERIQRNASHARAQRGSMPPTTRAHQAQPLQTPCSASRAHRNARLDSTLLENVPHLQTQCACPADPHAVWQRLRQAHAQQARTADVFQTQNAFATVPRASLNLGRAARPMWYKYARNALLAPRATTSFGDALPATIPSVHPAPRASAHLMTSMHNLVLPMVARAQSTTMQPSVA